MSGITTIALIAILLISCAPTPQYKIRDQHATSRQSGASNSNPTQNKNREERHASQVKPSPPQVYQAETGFASYTADERQGEPTASGEKYDMRSLTAAHPSLPFGTKVRVTNLSNGKSTVVRINDRSSDQLKWIIVLTFEGAKRLGFTEKGSALVEVQVLEAPTDR